MRSYTQAEAYQKLNDYGIFSQIAKANIPVYGLSDAILAHVPAPTYDVMVFTPMVNRSGYNADAIDKFVQEHGVKLDG